ncbi:MFS transporter [Nonomuraea sp. NPDC050556]|uniref:MFS transporter n=1 Tax=Nonomuraea sp. NPDC050556 TaxID=3364369 RepID=UPI00378A66B8
MRVLGVDVAPGFTRTNMIACWVLGFVATMVITFMPTAQPHLLSGVLGVAPGAQGRLVGLLGFVAELTMIVSLLWYGALADRVGRRPIVVAGFALCALGTALAPFAGSAAVLVALRVVFSLGTAALGGMFATLAIDYAAERSRGKSYGVLGVTSGLGAMFAVFTLARLPERLERGGMDAAAATRVSFLIVAAALLVAGVVMRFTLSAGKPAETHIPLPRLITEGVRLARDPGVALSYAAAFVARADLAVVSGFMSLWIVNYGVAHGMSSAQALARAGMVVGIAHGMSLIASPLLGWLGDRVRRHNLVIGAQLTAGLAYLSTLLVDDPLGPGMIIVAVFVGVGEIAGINTAGPLLGTHAPAAIRGSAFGVQALCGALGILLVSAIGGVLYDGWRPAAPFVVSGLLGLGVAAFGLSVRRRIDRDRRSGRTPEGSSATRPA